MVHEKGNYLHIDTEELSRYINNQKNKEQKNVCSICVNQAEGKIKRNIIYIIACILKKISLEGYSKPNMVTCKESWAVEGQGREETLYFVCNLNFVLCGCFM